MALKEKNFAEAIKNADVVLASNFADMDAHYIEAVSYREQADSAAADLHDFIFHGLLKSITDSGDGKSTETALQVIEVHEEYVVLRSMGVSLPQSQSSFKKNGHSYDVLAFEDPVSKQQVTLYFNVDISAKHGL